MLSCEMNVVLGVHGTWHISSVIKNHSYELIPEMARLSLDIYVCA